MKAVLRDRNRNVHGLGSGRSEFLHAVVIAVCDNERREQGRELAVMRDGNARGEAQLAVIHAHSIAHHVYDFAVQVEHLDAVVLGIGHEYVAVIAVHGMPNGSLNRPGALPTPPQLVITAPAESIL